MMHSYFTDKFRLMNSEDIVLILVVMDDALVQEGKRFIQDFIDGS